MDYLTIRLKYEIYPVQDNFGAAKTAKLRFSLWSSDLIATYFFTAIV
jgi:hypothetical protein